ncbi:hypothetical protein [uncultured Thomasclavelia sp.]|uniref:hypothetical protein n=1 Tax=uncultured Thomasclavelia sp. TaxID=3025759 RepID=UPI00261B4E28|nr:hypothetical protein [uncultured Thomasclavelia sp.]
MELMRFYSNNYNSDFSVIYIDGSEVTVIVGLDEDYSSRIYDNMTSPIDTLIDELKDLGVSEVVFIDNSLKQSIIEELKEQNDKLGLAWFNELLN